MPWLPYRYLTTLFKFKCTEPKLLQSKNCKSTNVGYFSYIICLISSFQLYMECVKQCLDSRLHSCFLEVELFSNCTHDFRGSDVCMFEYSL